MFLKGLYYFFQGFLSILERFFYEKTVTVGWRKFQSVPEPCIVVSNHPNTLLDPFNIGTRVKNHFQFLANAGLFVNPVSAWFWRKLWCIPIKRSQDKGANISNDDSFKQCDEFLQKGGVLFIAPEGSSYQERHIRPMKTGTARIAFSAESKNNFQLGLTIQPFGQTYSRQGHFWTRLFIKAAQPIKVADYKDLFEKDPEAAVDALTAEMGNRILGVVVDTDNLQQDRLLALCEKMLIGGKLYDSQESFEKSQTLANGLKRLSKEDESEYKNLENTVNQFFIKLRKPYSSYEALTKKHNWLGLILGFPFFIFAFFNNILPFAASYFVWKKGTPLGYDATVQYVTGLIFFPLFYTIQKNILLNFGIDVPYFGWIYWAASIASAALGWRYFVALRHAVQFLLLKNKEELRAEANKIVELLKVKLLKN